MWLTIVLAGVLVPCDVRAQQKKVVSGSVRDASGPLVRATISEKGVPANVVSSDAKGDFHITLRGTSNVLIISYVNFNTEEVRVKDPSNPVTVMLRPSPKGMDEVTVVGFGNTKQKATETGAVSSINAKEIEDVPTSSVQNALAG